MLHNDIVNDYGMTPNTESAAFRLNQRKFALTYSAKLPKQDFINWFSINHYDLKFYGICNETYQELDEMGNERYHTHVMLWTVKQPNIKDPRKFDYEYDGEIYHPNIKLITTDTYWNNWYNYIHKDDMNPITNIKTTDLDKNLQRAELIKTIQSKETWNDVICDPELHINWCLNWAREVFHSKKIQIKSTLKYNTLLPWQKSLYNKLKKPPVEREIIWVYSKEAKQGKTTFIKYLQSKLSVKVLRNYKLEDIAFSYNAEDLIVFDLPYAKSKKLESEMKEHFTSEEEDYDIPISNTNSNILSVYETISDKGSYTSCKYQGKTVVFNCHLLVFSNCGPEYISKYLPERLYPVEATLSGSSNIKGGEPESTSQLHLDDAPEYAETSNEIVGLLSDGD